MNNKYFFALFIILLNNIVFANTLPIGIRKADLPTYSPDNPNLSLWIGENTYMEGGSESLYLYSDGAYCFMGGAVGGFVSLTGKWQFNTNKTGIDIKINLIDNNQFFIGTGIAETYDYEQQKMVVVPNFVHITDAFFIYSPVYIGFGNQEIPNEMVLFEYHKHNDRITIPNNSKYLFVSSELGDDKEYKIARFDLSKINEQSYSVVLLKNDYGIGIPSYFGQSLQDKPPNYLIKSGKLGYIPYPKQPQNIKYFKAGFSIDLTIFNQNKHKENYQKFKDDLRVNADFGKLYRYCSGKSDEFYFDVLENEQSNLTKPTYIQWRGKIAPTADWLKPRD